MTSTCILDLNRIILDLSEAGRGCGGGENEDEAAAGSSVGEESGASTTSIHHQDRHHLRPASEVSEYCRTGQEDSWVKHYLIRTLFI